jgi:GNAT superfamily N-acetyltransferase
LAGRRHPRGVSLRVEGPLLEQRHVCERVLRALPQWFGIESATLAYIESAGHLPSFVAYDGELALGLVLFKQHFERAAEVYLIGVLPGQHRRGVGRALLAAGERWLREHGVQFLQVKTLSAEHPDVGYERTRQFYLGVGFTPCEVFPTLWSPTIPCLMLIKSLQA